MNVCLEAAEIREKKTLLVKFKIRVKSLFVVVQGVGLTQAEKPLKSLRHWKQNKARSVLNEDNLYRAVSFSLWIVWK
jgi:hypothetical protein